jgi:hypothetical protein
MVKKTIGLACIALLALLCVPALHGQGQVPPPRFGQATVGDDYFLANYTQLQEYWAVLDKASDRMQVVEIGKTPEGRPMMMAIITSPENFKNLEKYRDISVRLARAEGINEEQARTLASQGKAVVWIDGGLHADEIVNSESLFWMAYQMVTQNDAETLRILNDDILLLTPVNPDGMELVANWYMRSPDPKQRNMSIPRLYQKYVGHDNNRDSYTSNQMETQNINRQMYDNWIPQIMYNAHQTGPEGAIVFVPPFRDPFNYNQDPLVPMGIEMVASAIRTRWGAEGKAGFASRDEASYSTWFNGGDRTMTGFHNQIGILTEISGNPTPIEIGLVLSRQLPSSNVPLPIPPQKVWHFKQSIDYVVSAGRAHLDIASRLKDQWLYRIWRMGMNSIERGSKDNWTLQPSWIYEAQAAAAKEAGAAATAGEARVGSAGTVPSKYYDLMRTPARRDPRGYIIPSDQTDMPTVVKFLNMLIRGGLEVHRATGVFTVAGKNYPAGSYVLKAAQAFRPHLRDMMEPQDHPNDFFYPGGPPKPPYDVAGYTLAFQMGVKFDRILDPFEGPFEKLPIGEQIKMPAGTVVPPAKGAAVGYYLSHEVKDSFTATNRLLGAKEEVYWLKAPVTVAAKAYPIGTIYIPSKPTTRALLEKLAPELGVTFEGTATRPTGDALKLRTVKVGLWDQYGGDMASGWIRWMFEQQFQFPTFEVVYPPQLDAGNLKAKYDVIIFAGGIAAPGEKPRYSESEPPSNLPPEWADKVGMVTAAKTIPALKQFVEEGGTIIATGSATNIAYHLGLPVTNHLVERTPTGGERPLGSDKFFIPGSVIAAAVDNTNPIAWGMPAQVDMLFSRNPVFRVKPDAAILGTKVVAWYPSAKTLRSGWAWGQNYLEGGAAATESVLGKGKVLLFGPEITFRGQPHGTFPFLFNSIYLAGAQSANLAQAGKAK